MVFTPSKVFLSFQWLFVVMILFANTTPSQGLGRLCGPHLSQALDMICENGFATKTKKSLGPGDYAFDFLSADEGDILLGQSSLPFLSRMAANSLAKTRRRRHGIVHECCDKPCTLFELKLYCR